MKAHLAATRVERQNLRQLRVRPLVVDAIRRIEHLIEQNAALDRAASETDLLRDIDFALTELFTDAGVEIVTDLQRQKLGLPPRGPDGWTPDEIVAMEVARLEAMMRPLLRPASICDGVRSAYSDRTENSWRARFPK